MEYQFAFANPKHGKKKKVKASKKSGKNKLLKVPKITKKMKKAKKVSKKTKKKRNPNFNTLKASLLPKVATAIKAVSKVKPVSVKKVKANPKRSFSVTTWKHKGRPSKKKKNPSQSYYSDDKHASTGGVEGEAKTGGIYYTQKEISAAKKASRIGTARVEKIDRTLKKLKTRMDASKDTSVKSSIEKLIAEGERVKKNMKEALVDVNEIVKDSGKHSGARMTEARQMKKLGLKKRKSEMVGGDYSKAYNSLAMEFAIQSNKFTNEIKKTGIKTKESTVAKKKKTKKSSTKKARKAKAKKTAKPKKVKVKKPKKAKKVKKSKSKKVSKKSSKRADLKGPKEVSGFIAAQTGKKGLKKGKRKHAVVRKGSKKFSLSLLRSNPTMAVSKGLGNLLSTLDKYTSEYLSHSTMEVGGLLAGGMAHSLVNDMLMKFYPQLASKLSGLRFIGPFAGMIAPLAAGALLSRVENKQVQALGKGLVGSAIVGASATAYELLAARFMPAVVSGRNFKGVSYTPNMSGVNYTPNMSGVDFTPMKGVDYTPINGLESKADFGKESPADFGKARRVADFGAESPADFGKLYGESPADFGRGTYDEDSDSFLAQDF